MKHPAIRISLLSLPLAALLTALPGANAQAEETPQTLRQIMGELITALNTISEAIMREDWPAIVAPAGFIADHPRPPIEQRKKIMAGLGEDMPRFKAGDIRVHETAAALKAAASNGDGATAVRHYHELFDGCVACHSGFRERVRELKTE